MARAWLKQLRSEKSLTQAALASTAGLKTARYSRIEAGYCEPRDEEVKALAKALKQTEDFVRSGSRDHEKKEPKKTAVVAHPATAAVSIPISKPPVAPAVAPKGLSAANTHGPAAAGPRGDDLSDAKNFSLMPPTEALTSGALSPTEFRSRLQQHVAFATKVLHTSKVKPAVWVAWRDFNRDAQTLLRGNDPAPAAPVEVKPAPIPRIIVPPKPSAPASENPTSRRTRGNKNLFGYFLEVAEELLPPEKFSALSKLATTAKTHKPELGFMKHFKLIAEAELPPNEFSAIAAETAQRFSA
ncbi:MAG: helix-turn-helix domain-containing protein [Verrucomicrobia bacterium]|nr:helix-turn-helix domain-containing protein [Verrucomicrobiota bacterium]